MTRLTLEHEGRTYSVAIGHDCPTLHWLQRAMDLPGWHTEEETNELLREIRDALNGLNL